MVCLYEVVFFRSHRHRVVLFSSPPIRAVRDTHFLTIPLIFFRQLKKNKRKTRVHILSLRKFIELCSSRSTDNGAGTYVLLP